MLSKQGKPNPPLRVRHLAPSALLCHWFKSPWTVHQWQDVVFSNECHFDLQNDSKALRMWRTSAEANNLMYFQLTFKNSVFFYFLGCIAPNGIGRYYWLWPIIIHWVKENLIWKRMVSLNFCHVNCSNLSNTIELIVYLMVICSPAPHTASKIHEELFSFQFHAIKSKFVQIKVLISMKESTRFCPRLRKAG